MTKAIAVKFWRQPLFHFLLLGAVLFAVAGWRGLTSANSIQITPQLIRQLVVTHKQLMGVEPDDTQLRGMVEDYVEQELWFREAQRLGLERGDEIVRQRMVQKMQWMAEQQGTSIEPDDAALQTYYQQNPDEFKTQSNVSFLQLYFSPDRDSQESARQRAELALMAVQKGKRVDADRFPLLAGDVVGPLTQQQALALFGNGELVAKLFTSKVGEWSGPWQSGFGWHVMQVQEYDGGDLPAFDSIREQVRSHWHERELQEHRAATLQELRRRFTIEGLEYLSKKQ